ncbi:hypothetical protein [Novosphingobium mangrovi (ex Hu et al. 2023)]|uniref:Replication protein n=1 Tax=Novosphingobium mangrovi (ex Hu et al. 2023) TaxID=2930094 RepID=A0ABT0AAG3_9SPHN|nr:hypothetical protein [Novosphingobium mangrovi (ex Hu et al. 2023)]MCJ1960186.1 hypothetical protein [Novosphingobium mangrovi (ex Hu et al. 2023)]
MMDYEERLEKLIDALEWQAVEGGSFAALEKLSACGVEWGRRYACRSPGCPGCRGRNVKGRQKVLAERFAGCTKEGMGFLTIVLPGTNDLDQLGPLIDREKTRLRNRIRSGRAASPDWGYVFVDGTVEIDALSIDQVHALAPERRDLLLKVAPLGFGNTGPTWLPTFHCLVYRADIPTEEFQGCLERVWKEPGQVDFQPLYRHRSFDESLRRIGSYINKFTCSVDLCAPVRGAKIVEQWPAAWEADLVNWLHERRNAFERLHFIIGQKRS